MVEWIKSMKVQQRKGKSEKGLTDDQSFILDNVMNYQLDKAVKMCFGIGRRTTCLFTLFLFNRKQLRFILCFSLGLMA